MRPQSVYETAAKLEDAPLARFCKIMLGSLLYKEGIWPIAWGRRLALYWLVGEKDNLAFFAMLAVPVIMMGLIVHSGFILQANTDAARQRAADLRCLAENIYFEARGEPLPGQYAIAEVTMNRLASPYFPGTICEVVHDTRWDPLRRRLIAHFSWTELEPRSEPTGPAWKQAIDVATAVYDKVYTPVVPNALFYHATSIRPYWAKTKRVVAKIGNHVFYR
jgi:N-acetylmuramoyl-L-alanine amidase